MLPSVSSTRLVAEPCRAISPREPDRGAGDPVPVWRVGWVEGFWAAGRVGFLAFSLGFWVVFRFGGAAF